MNCVLNFEGFLYVFCSEKVERCLHFCSNGLNVSVSVSLTPPTQIVVKACCAK